MYENNTFDNTGSIVSVLMSIFNSVYNTHIYFLKLPWNLEVSGTDKALIGGYLYIVRLA